MTGEVPGQGTVAPADAQPPASGQGVAGAPSGQQPTSADGFRSMFSGISDEMWPQVEPHLRETQSRVTQLEQLSAPFRNAGISDPAEVQGLVQFAQNYQNNPVGVFLDMAVALQEAGVIDQDLDIEELAAVASGQAPSPNMGGAEPENTVPGQQEGDEVPPWAQ